MSVKKTTPHHPDRFIRLNELKDLVSLSKSTILRLEKRQMFPHRRKISANAVAWYESEILCWINSRQQAERAC